MTQLTIQQAFDLAVRQHQAGRFQEAEALYRQILAQQPQHAGALHHLGVIAKRLGQMDIGIDLIRQALALRPDFADAHYNLGIALKENGDLPGSIAAYRQAIALRPNLAEAHYNLGIALRSAGQFDEAIAEFRQTIVLRPKDAEAMVFLGNTLRDKRQFDEAIAAFRQAIAARPDYAEAHCNLGNTLRDKGQLDEGIAECLHGLSLGPNMPEAHNNLGNVYRDRGQLDDSISACRRALELNPDFFKAHSNLILTLYYHPGYSAKAIAEELARWNIRHAEPLRKVSQSHRNIRDPDRRLRIGYVSPDFRDHVVGRNLLPLFRHHDHQLFEIHCYSHVPRPDAFTAQFQGHADRWRNIFGLTDQQAADQVREDGIDILVDLALHTGGNRLLVFAHKPAPVQVTFCGYPAGTGLTAIDYRLTDPHLDPPGQTDADYTETSLRLPNSFWCYDPEAMDAPTDPIVSLPALKNGFVTFGCLNNFCKVNDGVLEAWAKVMRQSPNSRMILLGPKGTARRRVEEKFQREEIAAERLEWIDRLPREQYLQTYRRIDLGLDTFPYNGHTTGLDSLWMGVPVVTLSGQTAVSRGGRSILTNLGLPELIADTPDQFVQIALDLSKDLQRLDSLRQSMRARLRTSSLMDAPGFARDLEAAYRQMWRTWCQTPEGKS